MTADLQFDALTDQPLEQVRAAIRSSRYAGHTAGLARGRLQCNLAILPRSVAGDFRIFCENNPKPCPLAAVSEPGSPRFPRLGADLDIRTDAPLYNIYRDGAPSGQSRDLSELWRDDFVSFAIGCSFTFENALLRAGIGMRHIEENVTVPMFRSNLETVPSEHFGGAMVVSMRPIPEAEVERVREICARYPLAHGAPVHVGDPAAIGIADAGRPDWGSGVTIRAGEVPVFWACGVTPQVAIMRAALPLCITHAPGAMLIADIDEFAEPLGGGKEP